MEGVELSGEVLAVMIAETRDDVAAIRRFIDFLFKSIVFGFYAWLLWSYRGVIGRTLSGWAAEE